jgi:hypothetical protein
MCSPYYELVMTYASVELLLHAIEHFLRSVNLGLFVLLVSLSARVLLQCVQFLSDIQEVRSQFLQLTARNANQCRIKGRQPVEETSTWKSSNDLQNITAMIKICILK